MKFPRGMVTGIEVVQGLEPQETMKERPVRQEESQKSTESWQPGELSVSKSKE